MEAVEEKPTADYIADEKLYFKYQASRPKMLEKEWFEMFPEAREYLAAKLTILEGMKADAMKRCQTEYSKITANGLQDFDLWFAKEILRVWYFEPMEATEKHIKKIKWQLAPPSKDKNNITPEMIEKAKNYPFESLVGLNKEVGWVVCPFHNDSNPSLYVKNNFGHCFSCGKTVDTIQYMIEVKGMSFKQGVLALQ